MSDLDTTLAGYSTVATFTPTQLYSGEMDVVTTQEVAAAGNLFGTYVGGDRHQPRYQIVAKVAGKLVPYVEGGAGGTGVAYGVVPHVLDTTATGYNADVPTPCIVGGALNPDVLLPAASTYAQKKAAFARTNVLIQQLY